MKTRVIQSDPDEPATYEERAEAQPEHKRSTNVAGPGRCSAQHRKKAIFGWLALVVALFARAEHPDRDPLADSERSGVRGDRYLPKWLEWLPHFEHRGPDPKVKTPPTFASTSELAETQSLERSHHLDAVAPPSRTEEHR